MSLPLSEESAPGLVHWREGDLVRMSLGSSEPELAVYHGAHTTPCGLRITDEEVGAFMGVLRIVCVGPRTSLLELSGELAFIRDRVVHSAEDVRLVHNQTLEKHVVRIQRAWLEVYRRRVHAAARVQSQFRVANYDPAYRLCRSRLAKEFDTLPTIT
jgi:hypothetical protein